MTATEFLKSQGVHESAYAGLPDVQVRAIAKIRGWAAPKASATVVYYVPKESKKGPGMFLNIELEGARAFFGRLCDGDKLTDAAREALTVIANDIADHL